MRSPADIESLSMQIIDGLLPPLNCSEAEIQVIKRIVHASGDPEIARLVHFTPDAVDKGIQAILRGCHIFTDVKMAASGIRSVETQKFGCQVESIISASGVAGLAEKESLTRSAAAVRLFAPKITDSIIVIGNAPTALLALNEMLNTGKIRPALVIGMPVGFVEAAESKDELMRLNTSYICIEGNRGGSGIAAAAINALLILADKES